MKTVTLSIALILLFLLPFSACNERFYGKGITGTEYAHMQTPIYVDGKRKAKYLQFQGGEALKFDELDKNINGHLSMYMGYSDRILNASFGLNGYIGVYEAIEVDQPGTRLGPGRYPYQGLGWKTQVGFKTIFDNNVQWEYIGLQSHLFWEGGAYRNFRDSQAYFFDAPESSLRFINSLFTGLRWQFAKKIDAGLYLATNRNYFQRDNQKFHFYYFMNGPKIGGAINTGIAEFNTGGIGFEQSFFGSLSISFRF